ncbi:hypothetical protein N7478_001044 [Penicillium angulare]|uniref:uncharacterized protein n=1 Tax=Penicillium angulare TaxID=116970 RepID=UPI00253FB549|nr:uncharacterized protein N7478_001044 [Penicillium angulare]KAJ5291793.1 hypothetical protein N7478_001044 [Penicillium angulare]
MIVQNLTTTARKKSQDAKEMVGLLTTFYNHTQSDEKNAMYIKQQFLTGPRDRTTNTRMLKADGKELEPYAELLDAEVTRLQEEIEKSVERQKKEMDIWGRSKDTAITLGVVGVFCVWLWVGAGVHTDRAKKAMRKYNERVEQLCKDRTHKDNVVRLLELVRSLTNQLEELAPKMKLALNAMEELQGLFDKQDYYFQIVDQKLDNIETGVEGVSFNARQNWILGGIDEAVETFSNILGQNFKEVRIQK